MSFFPERADGAPVVPLLDPKARYGELREEQIRYVADRIRDFFSPGA